MGVSRAAYTNRIPPAVVTILDHGEVSGRIKLYAEAPSRCSSRAQARGQRLLRSKLPLASELPSFDPTVGREPPLSLTLFLVHLSS